MSFIKRFFFAFILLLAITSASTTIFPIGLGKVILILLLPYFLTSLIKDNFHFIKAIIYIYLTMFIIFLFVYLHTIYFESNDFSHSYIFLLNMIEFMFLGVIFAHIFKKYMIKDRYILLEIFVLSALINSIIVYINITIPSSRIIIQSIMPVVGNLPPDYLFRVGGLSNGPGASLSIFHSFGAIISYFLLSKSNRIKIQIKYTLITILILGSTLFISRTGFFLFFIIVGLYTLFFNLLNIKLLLRNLLYLISGLILLLLVVILLLNIILDQNQIYLFQERFIPWAFELFISYFESGDISSSSTNDLLDNHLFLPEDESSLWFGEAHYAGTDAKGHYIPSDSGYIRSIFSIGLIGSIIAYSFFPFILIFIKKYFLDKSIYRLLFIMICGLFIIEIKMPFMYAGKVNLILYIVIFSEISYFYYLRKKINVI